MFTTKGKRIKTDEVDFKKTVNPYYDKKRLQPVAENPEKEKGESEHGKGCKQGDNSRECRK